MVKIVQKSKIFQKILEIADDLEFSPRIKSKYFEIPMQCSTHLSALKSPKPLKSVTILRPLAYTDSYFDFEKPPKSIFLFMRMIIT